MTHPAEKAIQEMREWQRLTPREKEVRTTEGILRFFEYGHLPLKLQEISRPFCDLAHEVVAHANDGALGGTEVTVCLRKLLEAKDCAVRAAL